MKKKSHLITVIHGAPYSCVKDNWFSKAVQGN